MCFHHIWVLLLWYRSFWIHIGCPDYLSNWQACHGVSNNFPYYGLIVDSNHTINFLFKDYESPLYLDKNFINMRWRFRSQQASSYFIKILIQPNQKVIHSFLIHHPSILLNIITTLPFTTIEKIQFYHSFIRELKYSVTSRSPCTRVLALFLNSNICVESSKSE